MVETVVIVDYGSGNLRSAQKAFERAAGENGVKARISVSSAARDIAAADRVVLPGVGAFADCKKGLEAAPGVLEALFETVSHKQRPFLGICVGMQLMASQGLEHGSTKGFGWIPGTVRPLADTISDSDLKIPHMGWNTLDFQRVHPLGQELAHASDGPPHAYFVHSYHFDAEMKESIVATFRYGGQFAAAVARENMFGVQFHPEKSQTTGLKLIANFLTWSP
ncbi:MAG: imidazole glycerol phosphate synthase subunit HisH [Pseudomonadota bacterium]